MSASIDLTDATELKLHLGISGTDDDDLLDAIIEAVSAQIETYCDRKFKSEERTEYYNGEGYEILALRCWPVSRSADFTIYDDLSVPRDYASGDALGTDDYVIDYEMGLVHRQGAVFSDGAESVKVVYTAGVGATTATLPEDLRKAAVKLASAEYTQAKQRADGIQSEGIGPYRVVYDKSKWPADVLAILDEYRDVRFA